MAIDAVLTAHTRTGTGKGRARKLRSDGRIPAVIYGHGEATRSLSIDAHEFDRLRAEVHVENTIIDLTIDGERPLKTLVRDVQMHPSRGHVLHLDLYQIHAGVAVTVEVPIRLVGVSPGVRGGGIMQHAMVALEIRCLPDNIPGIIEVDISQLEIGDSIHVGDIALPDGVEAEVDAHRSVCSVMAPTVTAAPAEEAAEVAEVGAEPEVIGRGKEAEAEDAS
ncbi:MAG: 50S ribosomal protein L25 [Longimicrobiales bacterium]